MKVALVTALSLPLLVVSLASCSKAYEESLGWPQDWSTALSRDTVIVLDKHERSHGPFPRYILVIHGDGMIFFNGIEYVRNVGPNEAVMAKEEVVQILSEMKNMDFFSLSERYVNAQDGCRVLSTDGTLVIVSLSLNGRSHQVTYDSGCWFNRDVERLHDLENLIIEIIPAERWIN